MAARYYTYAHCRPDGTIFYIGKGTGARAYSLKRNNAHHSNVVRKYGAENIIVIIYPCASEADALVDEIARIRELRDAGVVLCNATNGGEGTSGFVQTTTTRAKISKIVEKTWHSADYREKVLDGHSRYWTKERREEQAQRASKHTHSAATKSRISSAGKARFATPLNKEKQCKILASIHANPEIQARRVAAIRAALTTPEYRSKKSVELSLLWEKRRAGEAPMPVRKGRAA